MAGGYAINGQREAPREPDAQGPPDPGWDGHLLLVYRTTRERRERFAQWLRQGLRRGEKVICTRSAVPPDGRLAAAPGQPEPIVARQVSFVEPAEMYPPDSAEALVDRALAEGYPAVRIAAGDGRARRALSEGSFRVPEATFERLTRTRPVSVLCQCDAGHEEPAAVAEATAAHHAGLRESQLATEPGGAGLRILGEVDVCNEHVFQAVVAAACSSGADRLELDLAGLEFLGVGGARALAEATERLRAAGAPVDLRRPARPVARVIEMLGLDGQLRLLS